MNASTPSTSYGAVLVPALQRIQHEFGYLQREALVVFSEQSAFRFTGCMRWRVSFHTFG